MFSGIVDRLGTIAGITQEGGAKKFTIETGYLDLALGESVAVNGVCLTVVSKDQTGVAQFFVSPETLARSNLDRLGETSRVNLERAVSLQTRLSGHMVQGHVDGPGRLMRLEEQGEAHLLDVRLGAELARYCVEKGSITLDGISLTINEIHRGEDGSATIGLTIIPHTFAHTNLHTRKPGDMINVEVDVIAKYVEGLCLPYLKP